MAVVQVQADQGGRAERRIEALLIDRKIRLVPNDDRRGRNSPNYIVMLDWPRVGEASKAQSCGDTPHEYRRVRLNDLWSEPKRAILSPTADGNSASLTVNSPARSADDAPNA